MMRGKRILACIAALAVLLTGCVTMDTEVMAAAKKPAKITLNYKTAEMSVGDKLTVKVKSVTPKNASKSVKWTTSDKKIAAVSSAGKVTAKKNGKATITATSKTNKKATAKCKITVYKATKKLTLSGDKAYTLKAGETVTLKASVTPAKGAQPVQWTSGSTKIAKVSAKGKVTAVSVGTATITGQSGKKKVTVKITVNKDTPIDTESSENSESESSGNSENSETGGTEIGNSETGGSSEAGGNTSGETEITDSGTWEGISWSVEGNKLTLSGEAEAGIMFANVNPNSANEYACLSEWGRKYAKMIVSADVKVTGLTDMSYMFADFRNLTSVNFEGTDTSKVTNMTGMFCSTTLYGTPIQERGKLTITGLNTENITQMKSMFVNNRAKYLDISSFDLSHADITPALDWSHNFGDSFLPDDTVTIVLPKICPADKVAISGTWQDEAGNLYTGYLPETTGTSFTITKVAE